MFVNDDFAVMQFTVDLGEELLENGGRVYSVQKTMENLLKSFDVHDYSLFVLSSGIFATLGKGIEERRFSLRSIPLNKMHLGRVAKMYELARHAAENADRSKLDEYREELALCAKMDFFAPLLRNLACGLASFGFCYLFGGSVIDCLIASVFGFIVQSIVYFLTKRSSIRYIPTVIGVAFASLVVTGLTMQFPLLNHEAIMTAAIITFMPGVAFTTSIRDYFNGDFISGNVHMTDVILRAVCIATGVGVGMYFWSLV
jgi:uncharacterized membrane protein YjjP (DUF1212 family)